MAKQLSYLDFSGMLNVNVSDFNKPLNEFSASKNVYEYKIGCPSKVPGYAHIGSQILNSPINTLYNYYQGTTKTNYLIAGLDSTTDYSLYYTTNGTFSAINTGSTYTGKAGAQPVLATYLDRAFIVGYKTSDSSFLTNATLTGTTFNAADSNLTSMPQGKYLVVYQDNLYVLNCQIGSTKYPSRAYFCDDIVDGKITWTLATNLKINEEDGDEITGGCVAYDRLLIFKKYSMWKWDNNSLIQLSDIGCDSYKSILTMIGIPYWFNRQGIYRWGGYLPQLISGKVQQFIEAIDQTQLANVLAIKHEFEYRLFIGTVTVEDIVYTNCWLCFDIRKEKWYTRCTYHTPRSSAPFILNSVKRAYFGTTNGYVQYFATRVDAIYSDDGQEIDSFFITNNYDFGDCSIYKYNTHVTAFSKNSQGLQIAVDADNKNEFNLVNAQFLTRDNCDFNLATEGIRYRFKIFEKGSTKSWEFEGMTITSLDIIENRN